ncbi:hypothetical protein E4V51_13330, partial [Paenibacillus sp. 28ISP30-2]|nr:hypothetical protein [Paenibacillus sp. 28ISP30-2]
MPKQQDKHSIQAWSLINRKYLGKGVRVKRFRKPTRCQVRNRVLLAGLMANDIKLYQLAENGREKGGNEGGVGKCECG